MRRVDHHDIRRGHIGQHPVRRHLLRALAAGRLEVRIAFAFLELVHHLLARHPVSLPVMMDLPKVV